MSEPLKEFPSLQTAGWAKFAQDYSKLVTAGPGVTPARELLKYMDAVYPFSSASGVLDVGCGPGIVANVFVEQQHMASLPAGAAFVSSDLAPSMIEQAEALKKQQLAAGLEVWERVETKLYDMQDLAGVPDGSFSHVTSNFGVFLVSNPRKALGEILRVLGKENGGGILGTSSWLTVEWMDVTKKFVRMVLPGKAIPEVESPWFTVEGVRQELETAGFREVDVHLVDTAWTFDDPETVSRVFMNSPFVSHFVGDITEEDTERIVGLMAQHLREKYPVMPGRIPGVAIVGIGRK